MGDDRSTSANGLRPRLLALNQYYWPSPEADGQLLAQLCEDLVDEYDVTVLTGRAASARRPGRVRRNGVTVFRMPSSALDRTRLPLRALNYGTYSLLAALAASVGRRPDVILSLTNPPFLGALALGIARRFGAPLVLVNQDVFPETALALGLGGARFARALAPLTRLALRRADRVVAIGETMRRRLVEKGAPQQRVRVIPNWVDASVVRPLSSDNAWSRAHGLADSFVVMHAGNVGRAQDLGTLVRASTLLGDLERLQVVIVGSGAGRTELIELAQGFGAHRVRFLPYQPRPVLSQVLSTATVHVVGLARGLAGYVVPSRLYGILAAGRPVIVAAEGEAETAQLVRREGLGVVVPPGDPRALAGAIRAAYEGSLELGGMGARARDWALGEGDRSVAVSRYRALLREVRAGR